MYVAKHFTDDHLDAVEQPTIEQGRCQIWRNYYDGYYLAQFPSLCMHERTASNLTFYRAMALQFSMPSRAVLHNYKF